MRLLLAKIIPPLLRRMSKHVNLAAELLAATVHGDQTAYVDGARVAEGKWRILDLSAERSPNAMRH
jgi:hypothetical protein